MIRGLTASEPSHRLSPAAAARWVEKCQRSHGKHASGDNLNPRGFATAVSSGDFIPDLLHGKALTLTVGWSRPVPPSRDAAGPAGDGAASCLDAAPSETVARAMCHFSTCLACLNSIKEQKDNPKGFQPHVESSCVLLMNGCGAEGMAKGDKPGPDANVWMGSQSSWTKLAGST